MAEKKPAKAENWPPEGEPNMEWTAEQREEVARQFHNVARGWRKWEDLGCGDRSVLWPECLVCHRIDTVTRIEDDSASHRSHAAMLALRRGHVRTRYLGSTRHHSCSM